MYTGNLYPTVALTLFSLFFIACGDAPLAVAPTSTAIENTAGSNIVRATATPYFVSLPAPSISLEHLQEFGRSFWDGVEYTCTARGNTGACITYDAEYKTYIFFAINNATKVGASYFVTPNKRFDVLSAFDVTPDPPHDFIEFCTYSDYERWHLIAYSNCTEETLPAGQGLAVLSIVLKEKWPELLDEIR